MTGGIRYGVDPITGAERIDDGPVDFAKRGPADDPAGPLPRVVVEHDTQIQRKDLHEGAVTFVAAGDAISIGLETLPRKKREP